MKNKMILVLQLDTKPAESTRNEILVDAKEFLRGIIGDHKIEFEEREGSWLIFFIVEYIGTKLFDFLGAKFRKQIVEKIDKAPSRFTSELSFGQELFLSSQSDIPPVKAIKGLVDKYNARVIFSDKISEEVRMVIEIFPGEKQTIHIARFRSDADFTQYLKDSTR